MKKAAVFAIAIAVVFVGPITLAQTSKPATPNGKAAPAQAMPSIAHMDEHLKKMQALHEKMMSATTPEERQKWMDEQHKSMQEGMRMVTRMIQDPAMRGRTNSQNDSADTPMQAMQKGIELMQLMTQMMMDQLGTMTPPKPEAPKK